MGSKVVRELQSRGLVILGDVEADADADATGGGGTEKIGFCGALGDSTLLGVLLGTENVKADCLRAAFCLRATFSLCNRVNRSRRFSFSFSACSFLASRSATLSSSYICRKYIRNQGIYTRNKTDIFNMLFLPLSECPLSCSVLLLAFQ